MPATPASVSFGEEKENQSYDDLEEKDYLATLIDVEDTVAGTGNVGWAFKFQVTGLTLTTKVWLKGGGTWRVRQMFNALGQPVAPGERVEALNPNPLIGRQAVITLKRKPYFDGRLNDDGTPKTFIDIDKVTPYVAEPVADFSDLG
jgi:hypothetical protein